MRLLPLLAPLVVFPVLVVALQAPGGPARANGGVSAIDSALILQFGAQLIASLPCQDNGDFNRDGTVNALDAALVLQVAAGLI